MHYKLIRNEATRTYALAFETGDAVVDELMRFARAHDLSASRLTAIGAFSEATLGFFDLDTNEYEEIPVEEQVEVLALVGNIAQHEGEPRLHAHATLGRRDGRTVGGHLIRAMVRPTLEVMLTEEPATLQRTIDPDTGLPLLDL